MSCLLKCNVWWWWRRRRRNNNVELSLLLSWSSSFPPPPNCQKSLKRTNELSKHTPTHVHKLTFIRTQSVSGAIRQRGSVLFWKKKKKNTNKESRRKKNKQAGSPSLLSSFWALVIPYCSSRVRRSPQPSSPQDTSERLREGWWVVCVGTEGRMEAGREEEAGQQAPPLPIQPITRAGAGGGFDWGRNGHQQWTWETERWRGN